MAKKIKKKKNLYVTEILEKHFPKTDLNSLISTSRKFPARVRADLQIALDAVIGSVALKCVGIQSSSFHDNLDFAAISAKGRAARLIAPLRFEEVDIGQDEPVRCLANGLWLSEIAGDPVAILLCRVSDMRGNEARMIEVAGLGGEALAEFTQQTFDDIEQQIRDASSYRGKVLSLEQSWAYSGQASGVAVHRLPAVSRDEVILPPDLLDLIDRTIINFTLQRESLKKYGQSTRRGVLLHGTPGTGKTHTIRYLASRLPEHTTLLVTAEQVTLLDEYFALARLLQPAILVIEDVDLIARDRETMGSPAEEALLNKLLNNMDGLREDADILFLLTTNRPQILEAALADRPGRIDQSVEFPVPDADCRKRLLELYAAELNIPEELREEIVNKTDGVSASFLKELARRTLQFSLSRAETNQVNKSDVDQALEDMLFSGGSLNAKLLGAGTAS